MILTRIDLRGRPGPYDSDIPRPGQPGGDVADAVASILARVRSEGDAAIRDLTRRFDGVELADFRIPVTHIRSALDRVAPQFHAALETAWSRICAYHDRDGKPPEEFSDGGIRVQDLVRPVGRAGCYVPGGRAKYPSTVLMCAAPAKVAGVEQVMLCVPPTKDGGVEDVTLAAAAIAQVDEIYCIGGAQAIAAMAYGTASIPRVDVIVGPGNRYVAEAKRQVAGMVGVAAAFAGPSEVVVIADGNVPPKWSAIDLVVQAEHGPDGASWLITWSEEFADRIEKEIEAIVETSPRRDDLRSTFATGGWLCLVDGVEEAIEVANAIAPEHLELHIEDPEDQLSMITAAGAVFCGAWSPASLGDYVAGPNHVLPTNRTARFASALRTDDFRKHIHAVTAGPDAIRALGPHVITFATAEDLPAHADSIRYRL